MLDTSAFLCACVNAMRSAAPPVLAGWQIYADIEPLKEDDGGRRVILRVDKSEELVRGNYTMRLSVLCELQTPVNAVQQGIGGVAGAVTDLLLGVLQTMRENRDVSQGFVVLGARVGLPEVTVDSLAYIHTVEIEADVQF